MAVLSVLLAGREGNGKSSTGNSIFGKKVFNPRATSSAASNDIIKSSAEIDGKTVMVVDGFSIRDNSVDGKDNVLATTELAKKALGMFDNGFNAMVICLKYGVRFTNQERSALSIIRSLFGPNIIKNYGVTVMTCGDNFAKDMEDEGTTFQAWCQQQVGDVQDLFKECGGRFLLFDNRTKDTEQLKIQVKDLMLKLAEIQSKRPLYTMDTFKHAEAGQRKLLVLSKLPELQLQTSHLLDSVTQSLRQLDDSYYSPSNYLHELDTLKSGIDEHKNFLTHEDEGTNSISHIMLQISVTEASISTKRERHLRKRELELQMSRARSPKPSTGSNTNFCSSRIFKVLVFLFVVLILIIIVIRVS